MCFCNQRGAGGGVGCSVTMAAVSNYCHAISGGKGTGCHQPAGHCGNAEDPGCQVPVAGGT